MKSTWEIGKLRDFCKTSAGGTPLKSGKGFYEGGTIPWLMSGEVAQRDIVSARNSITPLGLSSSSAKLFPPNTILVAMYGATAGEVGILRIEACTNQAVCGILPNEKFIAEFLYYQFLAKAEELVAQAVGNAQPNISQEKIRELEVCCPSLPEQQRIVAILDEAFAAIATAKANAERNLQNARALTDAKLDELFLPGAYGWPQLTVAEICSKITDGEHLRPKMTPSGIPFLSAKDVLDNGVDFSDPLYVAPSDAMKFRRRCDPEFGDVLVVSRGATVGRTCIVRSTRVFCLLGSVILLKVSDLVLPEFLAYTFKSKAIRTQLMTLSEASAQQAIYLRDIKTLRVNCPSPNDQARAVSRLNSIFLETSKLESLYRRKLATLDELKKSLLHRAFNGDL